MKKLTAIIFTLALLTAFTGCNNNETSGSVPDNGDSVSVPESTTENTESPDISESENLGAIFLTFSNLEKSAYLSQIPHLIYKGIFVTFGNFSY